MLNIAIELAQLAGHSLLDRFGQTQAVTMKGDVSNIVTAADTRAEQIIVAGLRQRFPGHSIISEELGSDLRPSDYTWIVDPLDGTSNYAAGIPWFGVLIALFRGTEPILAVLHTPVNGDLYLAEKGSGAERNGQRIHVSLEAELHNVLWAYGMDAQTSVAAAERDIRLLTQLLQRVRNVRATNSLIDAAYTADGRLGGMLNQSTRLWDIAAPMLLIQEAGGIYTASNGAPLKLDLSASAPEQIYSVLAGAPMLHGAVAELMRQV
ncbi:inositol monophosphatase family protein [Deefgea rivuli]|uniref:inositol monophosphatase family protein n=1 Tax=Deefgea rivuli TaxID=400948 RepID=UPI000482C0A5|nr:inositol monophosphatase [Deefgea rivuli]